MRIHLGDQAIIGACCVRIISIYNYFKLSMDILFKMRGTYVVKFIFHTQTYLVTTISMCTRYPLSLKHYYFTKKVYFINHTTTDIVKCNFLQALRTLSPLSRGK